MFARRARKRMPGDPVVAVCFEKCLFCLSGISAVFGNMGFLLPTGAEIIPRSCPRLALKRRHVREGFFGFSCVGVEERGAMADAATNIVFHFLKSSWFV